ncbi:hypothetical protein HYN51_03955 [Limnobaculum parvum]|uniref:Uncharacterized protein n=1 Tax=Limnobaculum parvum TaxID=2172103 RepID=A0A2Y9TVL9_9GAMM|nr:hypothetical protein HYN51_03955 [Limnobaculum parvum]
MIKKMTPYIFIFIFLYMTGAFFLFGLILRGCVGLIYTGSLNISLESIIKTLEMSSIAGILIAIGSFIFNIIDLRESRKKQTKSKDGE